MSGLEIAGVVLGALPLVISALEHYKSGQSNLAAIIKYRGHLETLLLRLKTQRLAFYFNILELLRSAEIDEVETRTDISLQDCVSILQNNKNGLQLQKYLGIHHGEFLTILCRYEKCLQKIVKKLRHIRRLPNAPKDDLAALLEANPPVNGAFSFTERISFSIERGTLHALIKDLGEDRLNLEVILKGMKTEKKQCTRHPSKESERLSRTLGQVSAAANALFTAMCQYCECACLCQNNHTVFLELHDRIPPTRSTRARHTDAESLIFNLIFEMKDDLREAYVKAIPHILRDTLPVRNARSAPPASGSHHLDHKQSRQVSFQNCHVLTPSITLSEADGPPETPTKVLGICDLVSRNQIGDYILSLKLEGEVLDFLQGPHQVQRELSTPTTLEAVLRQGAADKKLRITPRQKIQLALSIASSIIQLRKTCWSKPVFNSKVIKCVLGDNGKSARVSTVAVIEQVTDITRFASPESEPKVAMLELAILLLEIWHHETLAMWAEDEGLGGKTETTPDRLAAAYKWFHATEGEFPDKYLTAVEQCLTFCVQRSRKWDDSEFLVLYCENVIKPLHMSIL